MNLCVHGAPPLCLSLIKNVGLRYFRVSPFRLVHACTARIGQPKTGRAESATCCSAGPNQASATCTARYGTPRCTAAVCQEREVWHCHSTLHYYSGTATCQPSYVPWVTDSPDANQNRSRKSLHGRRAAATARRRRRRHVAAGRMPDGRNVNRH